MILSSVGRWRSQEDDSTARPARGRPSTSYLRF
jgi:hypothetical protein